MVVIPMKYLNLKNAAKECFTSIHTVSVMVLTIKKSSVLFCSVLIVTLFPN